MPGMSMRTAEAWATFRWLRRTARRRPFPIECRTACGGITKGGKAPQRYDRKRLPFTPAEEQRFEERTMVERV
jgi:hypothetical protein